MATGFMESQSAANLIDTCKRQFKAKCDFVDLDSDEYLKTWMAFRYLFIIRDQLAHMLKTNPDSLIDLENLYLVSRTGNLQLLHEQDQPNSPLSTRAVSNHRRFFRELLQRKELAAAQAGFDRERLLDEAKDIFKLSSGQPKSKERESHLSK